MQNKAGTTSETDWQAIKSVYETTSTPIKKLCDEFGLKPHHLYQRARQEGWVLRSTACLRSGNNKTANKKSGDKLAQKKTKQSEAVPPPKKNGRAGQTIKEQKSAPFETLREALEFITMDLITRIKEPRPEGEENFEKEARTLSSLVRTYEKLKTIDTETHLQKLTKQTKATPEHDEAANQRRRNLAARLEKLIQSL